MKWYYQHLPGDDWDTDYTHERTLVTTPFDPDPKAVKWINPDVKRGEPRDMAVMVGEGGGVFRVVGPGHAASKGDIISPTPWIWTLARVLVDRAARRQGVRQGPAVSPPSGQHPGT